MRSDSLNELSTKLAMPLSRRHFVLGASVIAASALLAACEADDDDGDDTDPADSDDTGDEAEDESGSEDEDPEESEDSDEGDEEDSDSDDAGDVSRVSAAIANPFDDGWDAQFMNFNEQLGLSLLMNEPLVYFNEAMEFVPKLAESWESPSDDEPEVWTFQLREGVMFHDGTPFNAEAVEYSWTRLLDPETAAPAAGRLDKAYESMEIVDDYTIAVRTKGVYPDFLDEVSRVTTAILSPAHTEQFSVAEYGENPVGTGPFRFREWPSPDVTILEANPDYWGDAPVVDEIELRSIHEPGARVAGLEAGELDFISNIPLEEVERLNGIDGIVAQDHDSMSTLFIHCLHTKEPWNDLRVRQALNHAIDKQAIIDNIYLGFAELATSPLFPGVRFRAEFDPYEYNPERAMELLAEAGYPDGFDCDFWFTPYTAAIESAVIACDQFFNEVGIRTNLQQFEATQYADLITDPDSDDRDLFITQRASFGTDNNLTRLWGRNDWDTDNRGRFLNEEFEELLVAGRASLDDDEREEIYRRAQEILWEEASDVFLWHQRIVTARQESFDSVVVLPDYTIHLNGV